MKIQLIHGLSFQALLCNAAVIQPRSPQTPTSSIPNLGALAGLLGRPLGASFGGSAANGAIGNLLKNGGLGNLAQNFLPETKVAKIEDLTPALKGRTGTKRQLIRFGPQVLVGKGQKKPPGMFSLDPHGQSVVGIISKGLCTNCTILSGRTGLVFEDGKPATPADNVYVHHILSVDLSKSGSMPVSVCDYKDPVVNSSSVTPTMPVSGFIGQGEDNGDTAIFFTTYDGSYPSGFHIGSNDKFLLQTDLVNYNPENKTVYVTFDLEYVDGHVGADAVTNLLSVTGCKVAEPKLNKTGSAITDSQKFPVLEDGHIVSMRGHMHNGGESMILSVNGKQMCTSTPSYDSKGKITGMSGCDKPIAVFKNDTVEMKSVYDLSKHALREGADGGDSRDIVGGHDVMGMFTFGFSRDPEKKKIMRTF